MQRNMDKFRYYIFISVICFVVGCATKRKGYIKEFDLSNEIYQIQKQTCGDKDYLKIFEYNRRQVSWMNDIEAMTNDTVYILEKRSYSDEIIPIQYNYYSLFWNKKNPESIKCYNKQYGNIKESKEELTSNDILLHLTNIWDTIEIKKRAYYGGFFGGGTDILLTRIIYKEKKQIEAICFNEFFEGNY